MSIRTAEDFDALVARIKEQDREVKAWRAFSGNSALKAARIGEFDHAPRPLEGLTVGVKDIIDVAGLQTRYGSPLFEDAPPAARDAAVVAKMREAGAIIVGKTVTTELATFVPAETRNPRDLTRTPGGSSSGSAAAVAAGHVDIAIGTQTAGSIIRPAAYCGVYGFKPSFGLVPTDGVLVQCPSFDTVGVFARSLTHIEAWMAAVTHDFPSVPKRTSDEAITNIWISTKHLEMAAPEVQLVIHAQLKALIASGWVVHEVQLPEWANQIEAAHATMQSYESSRVFDSPSIGAERLSPSLLEYARSGLAIPTAEYESAKRLISDAAQHVRHLLGPNDVMLLPGVTEPPGDVAFSTGSPLVHRFASALGLASLAIPRSASSGDEFWAGIQLVGSHSRDAWLLRTAANLTALG